MSKQDTTVQTRIEAAGIVPVIRIDKTSDAVPLVEALSRGGLPVAEITFRTESAEESIRLVAAAAQNILVGAGTVLTIEQVKRAVDAGAQFIVTPGFNSRVVEYCVKNGIAITPGVNNPTGVEQALEFGLTVLKFFPAQASGGTAMLKALGGPYGQVKFVPTGGVSLENLAEYLSLKNVAAIGGSWIVPPASISAGDFGRIETLTREAVAEVKKIRGA
jgi:2-dehydro-3-deoxyphosphogluconate aldolase / (4S)-4-hydroxy-2-oxoglutarate aldolase